MAHAGDRNGMGEWLPGDEFCGKVKKHHLEREAGVSITVLFVYMKTEK